MKTTPLQALSSSLPPVATTTAPSSGTSLKVSPYLFSFFFFLLLCRFCHESYRVQLKIIHMLLLMHGYYSSMHLYFIYANFTFMLALFCKVMFSPSYVCISMQKFIFRIRLTFTHAFCYFIFIGFVVMLVSFHKTMLLSFYICTHTNIYFQERTKTTSMIFHQLNILF